MIDKMMEKYALDIYLFNKGLSYKAHEYMGAHFRTYSGIQGLEFMVWAPACKSMALVGDFNQWDPKSHLMVAVASTGMWYIFVEGLEEEALYKYLVESQNGDVTYKSDPFAFYSELKPKTASRLYDLEGYGWSDDLYMTSRMKKNVFKSPLNIYEVHLSSWQKKEGEPLSYLDLCDTLIPYVKEMAYSHIEIMPLMEHPFDGSWGYQATGYFSMTSRYGPPKDLMAFIDACHQADIGVIFDWVPCHFCNDQHGLRLFDGGPTYEHPQSHMADNVQWGTTNFDYSKSQVRSFLISNAMFFLEKFHVDGLRVDAVAFILYQGYTSQASCVNQGGVAFLQDLNKAVFHQHPDVLMMAEESSAWPKVSAPIHQGGLGFNFKWNMGWMNDMLTYIETPFQERVHKHDAITFSIMYAFTENFVLALSHDEVVHGKKSLLDKMPGDYWQKFAGLRMFYGYMYAYPGKKLLFMGGEFGQFIEWDYKRPLDWFLKDYHSHQTLAVCVKTLNHLYKDQEAFYINDDKYKGFEWIDYDNRHQSIVSFIRNGRGHDHLVVICNFTPKAYENFSLGVPRPGRYDVILDTDDLAFGGSAYRQTSSFETVAAHKHGRPYQVTLALPPLATLYLKYIEEAEDETL